VAEDFLALPSSITAGAVMDQLFQQNVVGMAIIDSDGRYVRINDALATMNGIPAADHIGHTLGELLPGAAERMAPLLEAVLAGRPVIDLETAIDEHGGRSRTFRGSFLPIAGEDGVVEGLISLIVETTEGARVEAALRMSRERLQLALEGTETGTFEWDVATNALVWSDNMGPIWGRERGWMPADYEDYLTTLTPEDGELLAADVQRATAEGVGYEREHRVLLPSGEARWVHSKVHVLRDDEGNPSALIGLVNDVTARRERENAEQAAHRRLRALQSVTDIALAHLELDDLLKELLERVRDITGSDLAEVLLVDEVHGEVQVTAAGAIDAPPGSTVRVPLRAESEVIGSLRLCSVAERTLAPEDAELLELVADRAARAIAHARVYEQARTTAVTLQRSLLPAALPRLPGYDVAVRYLPGQEGAEVGGDFYDVFPLPDGRFAVVVGDVVGRGVTAAADMGQLRAALRAYAYEHPDPAHALELFDRLTEGLGGVSFATISVLALDPQTGEGELALAGHPPAVVRSAAGGCTRFPAPAGVPIGSPPGPREKHPLKLEHCDLVLFYTDGLVERRGITLDDRIDALCAAVESGPTEPDALLDHVLAELVPGGSSEDDVALVAVRRTT
jgi:PAS domain S-box-containing protein